MKNLDIRKYAKDKAVNLWEISEHLGYAHEAAFSRVLSIKDFMLYDGKKWIEDTEGLSARTDAKLLSDALLQYGSSLRRSRLSQSCNITMQHKKVGNIWLPHIIN